MKKKFIILLMLLVITIAGCDLLSLPGDFLKSSLDGVAVTEIDNMTFAFFDNTPVDFDALFSTSTMAVPGGVPISPFVNYANTNHAEGPRKWYLYGQSTPLQVVMPAQGLLKKDGIKMYSSDSGQPGTVNDEAVLIDVQAWFHLKKGVQMFFMHLCLRQAIKDQVDNSENGYIVLEAGTHIGYMYYPPMNSVDFGIEDRTKDGGATPDRYNWLNIRMNPFDYFTTAMQAEILLDYQEIYTWLDSQGNHPYSDLTDSRADFNVQDKLWGIWFRDDMSRPLNNYQVNWSIINIIKKEYLHSDTFSKTLGDYPELDGFMAENGKGEDEGKTLYQNGPFGNNLVFLESGTESAGVIKIQNSYDANQYTYLKYEVKPNGSTSKFDDKLVMEGFSSQDSAEAASFSSNKVTFRRTQ